MHWIYLALTCCCICCFSYGQIPGHLYLKRPPRHPEQTLEDLIIARHLAKPTFDESAKPKNVTTQIGQTVYLHCIVRHLGDKMVTWLRKRDLHVLTVGLTTYTSDDRFQSIHMEHNEDWVLQIRRVQLGDAGVYECQVNTHPLISLFITLNVVVPRATLREAPELYVKTGSAINLTCEITASPEPPAFVFWYHNDRMINYDAERASISIQKAGVDRAISRLYITDARLDDSGNYTCCPSNAEATSVSVHVLNGEKRAAMQHDITSHSKASGGPFPTNDALRIGMATFLFWRLQS